MAEAIQEWLTKFKNGRCNLNIVPWHFSQRSPARWCPEVEVQPLTAEGSGAQQELAAATGAAATPRWNPAPKGITILSAGIVCEGSTCVLQRLQNLC